MNCINHPEIPVSAYCQNCGKPLCQECVRSIGGVIYCEACLAARLNSTSQPNSQPGAQAGPGSAAGQVYVGLPAGAPNPGLALGLGFIPGVGAMYNGQFVKGLAHVIIFAVLCSLSDHGNPLGILVAFWVAYQVFDAYQTARARRDGTPLPNPFGLNDLGYRLGLQQHPGGPGAPPVAGPAAPYARQYAASSTSATGVNTPSYPSADAAPSTNWTSYVPPQDQPYVAGFVPGSGTGSTGPMPPYAAPYQPNPYTPPAAAIRGNDIPTGAIVLIALGVLFLLGSLGIFHDDWISRAWPLAIVGVGVWLLIRRARENRLHPGYQAQAPSAAQNPPVPPPSYPSEKDSL